MFQNHFSGTSVILSIWLIKCISVLVLKAEVAYNFMLTYSEMEIHLRQSKNKLFFSDNRST